MAKLTPEEQKAKFAALLAKIRAREKQETAETVATPTKETSNGQPQAETYSETSPQTGAPNSDAGSEPERANKDLPDTERVPDPATEAYDRYGNLITYNAKQAEAVNLARTGKSFIVIGAAGTGKTTVMQGVCRALIAGNLVRQIVPNGHKYLPVGAPGILIMAYTRRATNNIRRVMPEDLKWNCITIHKALQYEPVYYEVMDPKTGKARTTMRFEATRTRMNPIHHSVRTVIIEEASMPSVELYKEVEDATPHNPQFIFLGDIQQLPPVFGSAILGFKMLELPTVELTEVYRQALESPIIRLAHRILSGKGIPASEFPQWKFEGQLTLHPWAKRIKAELAVLTLAKFFQVAFESGRYDPEEDMILIPHNVSCGTIEMNKHVAQGLARKENAKIYEVIAGFQKHYFRIGERILFDREDAEIIDIYPNPKYGGKRAQKASTTLDYWGTEHSNVPKDDTDAYADFDVDKFMEGIISDEDRTNQASHTLKLKLSSSDAEIFIDQSAQVNAILLGYALTVHKAQGSEWRRVFCCFHQSHAAMMMRELLYTAVTRAREELYVICEPDQFVKGVEQQRIVGNTLAEKAEYFKGKQAEKEAAVKERSMAS